MPRAKVATGTQQAQAILAFARTAPLENAELVLGLAQGELRARKQKSAEAKARATQAATEAATTSATTHKPKKVKAKAKAKRTKTPKAAQSTATAADAPAMPAGPAESFEEAAHAEAAGDLVGSTR